MIAIWFQGDRVERRNQIKGRHGSGPSGFSVKLSSDPYSCIVGQQIFGRGGSGNLSIVIALLVVWWKPCQRSVSIGQMLSGGILLSFRSPPSENFLKRNDVVTRSPKGHVQRLTLTYFAQSEENHSGADTI